MARAPKPKEKTQKTAYKKPTTKKKKSGTA